MRLRSKVELHIDHPWFRKGAIVAIPPPTTHYPHLLGPQPRINPAARRECIACMHSRLQGKKGDFHQDLHSLLVAASLACSQDSKLDMITRLVTTEREAENRV